MLGALTGLQQKRQEYTLVQFTKATALFIRGMFLPVPRREPRGARGRPRVRGRQWRLHQGALRQARAKSARIDGDFRTGSPHPLV